MKNLQGFEIFLKSIFGDIETEYRFHPVRRWRFDYAIPDKMLAIEIEGGNYIRGRHVRAVGYEKDCEKYNTAQIMGWKVLRYTYNMLKNIDKIEAQLREIKLKGFIKLIQEANEKASKSKLKFKEG